MENKIWIGAHTSTAGGCHQALYQGKAIGATTIQLFTSNQKQWEGRSLSKEEIEAWNLALEETGLQKVMSHDSYLINLGAADPEVLHKSRKAFKEEIQRCHLLNIPYLNFHPGAATTRTLEESLKTIVESLLEVEELVHIGKTLLLLETTAGQGTSVGHKFEHLAEVLSETRGKIPLGVCIDTCHIFVAGYDIRTKEAVDEMLKEFDRIIGLKHLKAFHFNDSQKELGSRVDRHAPLGEGKIGWAPFRYLMRCPHTASLPKYLETPDGPELWKKEIALLKQAAVEK